MSELEPEMAYFNSVLSRHDSIDRDLIRRIVDTGPFSLTADQKVDVIRRLESSFDIRQSLGNAIAVEHVPWLRGRRSADDFQEYYWARLKRYYLTLGVLPPHVVGVLDKVSDQILDYCGDPTSQGPWKRRGMVLGHVQSGKTTNYSALICKAADAGYKIIILLAGLTNSLRQQTQERLDETFIGRKSVFRSSRRETLPIVRFHFERRYPIFGTSRDRDFSKEVAASYGVTLSAVKEPVIFVTKKNKTTLERLRDWLREQQHAGLIDAPVLLVDDEADNASINTASDPNRTTAINKAIREILAQFSRSSYVGYTATPFANIFIDPDTEDEMLEDDLFPRDFIKTLDPPSNYVSATRMFSDEGDLSFMVKTVDDYHDLLPLKH